MASQVESLSSDCSAQSSVKQQRLLGCGLTRTLSLQSGGSTTGAVDILLDRTNTQNSISSAVSRSSAPSSCDGSINYQKRKFQICSPSEADVKLQRSSSTHSSWTLTGSEPGFPLRLRLRRKLTLDEKQGQSSLPTALCQAAERLENPSKEVSRSQSVVKSLSLRGTSEMRYFTLEDHKLNHNTVLSKVSGLGNNRETPSIPKHETLQVKEEVLTTEDKKKTKDTSSKIRNGTSTLAKEDPMPDLHTGEEFSNEPARTKLAARNAVSQLLSREARPRTRSLQSTGTASSVFSLSPALSATSTASASPRGPRRRNRQQKAKRYTIESVRKALSSLSEEITKHGRCNVRSAARNHNIPPETLRRFWNDVKNLPAKERDEKINATQLPLTGNQKKRYFSVEEEQELAEHIRDHERQGNVITPENISQMASMRAVKLGHADAKCGRRWVDGFLRRNSDIIQCVLEDDLDRENSTLSGEKRRRLDSHSGSVATSPAAQPLQPVVSSARSQRVLPRAPTGAKRSNRSRRVITSSPVPPSSLLARETGTKLDLNSNSDQPAPRTPRLSGCSAPPTSSPSTLGQTPSPVASRGGRQPATWPDWASAFPANSAAPYMGMFVAPASYPTGFMPNCMPPQFMTSADPRNAASRISLGMCNAGDGQSYATEALSKLATAAGVVASAQSQTTDKGSLQPAATSPTQRQPPAPPPQFAVPHSATPTASHLNMLQSHYGSGIMPHQPPLQMNMQINNHAYPIHYCFQGYPSQKYGNEPISPNVAAQQQQHITKEDGPKVSKI